jgi:gliding motility-associated lipoprotein GldH
MKKISLILLLFVCLCSCHRRTVFIELKHVNQSGWNKDSVLRFCIPVADTALTYDILLHVRHTERYPYQNMWLFLNDKRDTVEFYLADDHGIWLGKRGNGHIKIPVILEKDCHFTDDTFRISLQHGMRQDNLAGITDIGIEVCKSEQ